MSYQGPTADIDGYYPPPQDRIERYQEKGHWKNRTLHEILDEQAQATPDKPLTVGPDGTRSYEEIVRRSKQVAAYLVGELGLEPQDRVALQLTNRAEFLELFFGCSRVGIIPVMVYPRHRQAEVRHIVELADAKAFVTVGEVDGGGFDYVDMLDEISSAVNPLEHTVLVTDEPGPSPDGWISYGEVVDEKWTAEHPEAIGSVDVNPCNPAVFVLSGGTTGMPKALPRTHNDYGLQWEYSARAGEFSEEWVTMTCVAIGHNASLIVVMGATIAAGGTIALEPVLKPASLMNRIEAAGVNYGFAIPTQLVDFLEHPDLETFDLSSLKALMSGGHKVRPQLVYESTDRWGIEFYNVFGMAEGPLMFTRPGDDVEVQANTVGRPIYPEGDELKIVDDRGEEVPVGTPGELIGRGPGYFTGYFRNPDANAETFDDEGWLHTGDVLAYREDGNYEVHGRLKDTIIRGGENIYAPGVEDEIMNHPKVANVAVIGMPDDRLGERPCAYIVLEDGAETVTLDELAEFLEERGLAVFKRPERVEIVDKLPRTEVEKVDKVELVDRVVEKLKAEGALSANY